MTSPAKPAELLPCPFCGGTDLYWPHGTDPAVIKCGGKDGCGTTSGIQDGEDGEQTEALAIAVWNRRAPAGEPTREGSERRRADDGPHPYEPVIAGNVTDDIVKRLRKDVFYGDERMERTHEHNPLHMDAANSETCQPTHRSCRQLRRTARGSRSTARAASPREMADMDTTERLLARQTDRIVDIVQGRDDGRTSEAHYLIVERDPLGYRTDREIEQFRDLERVVANAADFETGDRHGKWLGAFTATYRDGKLAGVALVENMPARVAIERHRRKKGEGLASIPQRNILKAAE